MSTSQGSQPLEPIPEEGPSDVPLIGRIRQRSGTIVEISTRPIKRARETVSPVIQSAASSVLSSASSVLSSSSIIQYISDLVGTIGQTSIPSVSELESRTVRHQARALRSLVNHVESDFERAQLPVKRDAIARTILQLLPSSLIWQPAWGVLSNGSWKANNQQLGKIFSVEDALHPEYTIPSGTTCFYMRSRRLHVADVQQVMELFNTRFYHPTFMAKLDRIVNEVAFTDTNEKEVYLRYIGTCDHPLTPADRLHEDQCNSSLFSKISLCLDQLDADGSLIAKETEWTVVEFISGRTQCDENSADEFTERILISLLGYDSLINVQRGGYYGLYEPSEDEQILFLSLETNVIESLIARNLENATTTRAMLPDTNYTESIEQHFQEVFSFVRDNASATLGRSRKYESMFTGQVRQGTIEQAIPLTRGYDQLGNATLVVVVGKDMTLESCTGGGDVRFFYGKSRGSYLARGMLSSLAKWEGSYNVDPMKQIPFVDLYPWLLVNEHSVAERFLSNYLKIVRPIITIAFSKRVSGVLQNGFSFFGNLTGEKTSRMIDRVGTMVVESYDNSWLNDETQTEPPEDSYTIVIAHYDPGHDKYGDQHPLLRKMMLLSWMVTFALMDVAMRYMDELGPNSERLTVCQAIVAETQRRVAASGLFAELETTRENLERYITTAAAARAHLRRPLSDQQRLDRRVRLAMNRLLSHAPFILTGAPNSEERQDQAERIYALRRPEFGLHIPYDNHEAWMEWTCSRPQGTSLITATIAVVTGKVGAEPQGVIIRALGMDPDKSKWTDPQVQEIFAERLTKMRAAHGRFLQSVAGRSLQRERALKRFNSNALATVNDPLEGRAVTCCRREVSFYATIDGTVTNMRFFVPLRVLTAQPRLRFELDGIHLMDDVDVDLGLAVPVHNMAYLERHGKALQAVWKSEMERKLGRELRAEELPLRAQGRDPPKYAPRKRSYPVKPIHDEDALWVFRKWLDQRFPDAVNEMPFHWQNLESPVHEFVPWMVDEYPLHPALAQWRRIFEADGTIGTNILRGCVVALRGEVNTEKQYGIRQPDGRYKMGKVWKFGPPRTDELLE
ncbi:hypothetical protein BC832DRAFT_551883 [Gaertneriomyces semiglobifer]|nr:hypothetical protein BC832DRAFT_551883 [Gaertneriomyces semiglobifer]